MKKQMLSIATAALAANLIADTITWTGGAGTTDWTAAGNWDLNRAPMETDDVVISGAAVTASGSRRIPQSLTMSNGASYTIGGEIQFGNDDVTAPVIYGGTVTGTLVASQFAAATLTISDAAIVDTGTGHNGFWQNTGSYLNFVDGANRAASFTYQKSIASDPFYFFSNPAVNPYIRYNGEVVSREVFDANFSSVDNGNGTVTLHMTALTGWRIAKPEISNVQDAAGGKKTATVSADASKVDQSAGTPAFTVVWDVQDNGESISDWPAASRAVASFADGVASAEIEFDPDVDYYARVFAVYEVGETSETAVSAGIAFKASSVDYGGLTDVYEYVGTNNRLDETANWTKDGNPVSALPTAGTDIRWFGGKGNYSGGSFSGYATDRFVAADIAVTGDFNAYGDLSFSNSTISAGMIVLKNGHTSVSLYGSTVYVSRTDAGQFGFYDASYANMINFVSGKASAYTGRNSFGVTDKASAYAALVETGRVVLDDAVISAAAWADNFVVSVDGSRLTVSYNPDVVGNILGVTSESNIKDDSATASVVVSKAEGNALLAFAYGTAEPSDEDLLGDTGAAAAVGDTVMSRDMTGLVKGTTYHYRFAIVAGGEIKASAGGSFVAKEYDAVYRNGAWEDGVSVSLTDASMRVLFASDYDTSGGEMASPLKVVENARLTVNTLINGSAPTKLHNGWLVATRPGSLTDARYSLYPNDADKVFLDFVHDAPSNGIVYRASCYSFRYDDETWPRPDDATLFAYLFGTGRFRVGGEQVSAEDAAAAFMVDDDTENSRVYLCTVDDASALSAAGASAPWSFQPGARVRLSKAERIGAVTIADSTGVKIDLGGNKLSVAGLFIDGVRKTGKFTSKTLGILSGEGELVVGGGLAVIIR